MKPIPTFPPPRLLRGRMNIPKTGPLRSTHSEGKVSVPRKSIMEKRELLRSRMVELIREIVETQGEVTIGKLGAIINVRDPIFSPSRYGSGSLSALLKQLGGINLSPVEREDGSVKDYEVRLNEH